YAHRHGVAAVVDAIVANPGVLASANETVRQIVRSIYLDNSDAFLSDFALVRHWRPTNPPARQRLSSIKIPTLLLVGDRDTPHVRATVDVLSASIHGAKTVVIANAGHLLNLDAPEAFNSAVADF